jgi:hypothetical protein
MADEGKTKGPNQDVELDDAVLEDVSGGAFDDNNNNNNNNQPTEPSYPILNQA